MTIKEQIEIARLIASGTPREVAISEAKVTSSLDRTGAAPVDELKPQEKSNLRTAVLKARQAELKRKRTAKPAVLKKVGGTSDTSEKSYETIDKDEGGASAVMKFGGNILKKTGILNKKSSASNDDEKLDVILKKISKTKNISKKEAEPLQATEEFIQEVEDKKGSKAKKVIDIMRGKNSIKINPDVKENTVVVQDASGKDFVEIVDIITPQKVRSDWRKEINVTEASAAWQRKEGKSKSGGLNEKGRKSYERQNPGSDLKAPSKKVGNKRRASFCARMKGMKKKLTSAKTARDPDSRINKSLRAWNC